MSDNKKYYYLKLKDNFFDRPEIKAIENIPNGYEYICIMQKMYLRSLSRNGKLMLTDTIPYNPELLSSVLGHRIEVVSAAIDLFKQFDLLVILDDSTIYMTEIQNFIGQSSTEGDRKRIARKEIETHQLKLSGQMSDNRPPEIEIELDKERELKTKKKKSVFIPPTIDDINTFAKEKGHVVDASKIIKHYDYNNTGIWTNSKGKPVKDWKRTLEVNWFNETNKLDSKTTQSKPFYKTTGCPDKKWGCNDLSHEDEYIRKQQEEAQKRLEDNKC